MKSICDVCGIERVKVRGLVCPEGHGRIWPVPPPEPRGPRGRPQTEMPTAYAELPVAGASKNAPLEYWLLAENGKQLPGLYRRVPRRAFSGPTISARLNGRACKFTLIEATDGTP